MYNEAYRCVTKSVSLIEFHSYSQAASTLFMLRKWV